MLKKCQRQWKVKKMIFPVADGILEKIRIWDHPLESGIVWNEERNKKFFEENQADSLLHHHNKRTQHEMMRKLFFNFWSITRDFIYRHQRWTQSQNVRAERSIIPNSTEAHRRYQNNTHVTGWIDGNTFWRLLEREIKIETCQMPWQDSQDLFYLNEKATWRIFMVREWDARENKRPQDPTMYGQICRKRMSDAAKRKAKQKWVMEKTKTR